MFNDQLNSQIKTKQDITSLILENEKRIQLLKRNLSNIGVNLIAFYLFHDYLVFYVIYIFNFRSYQVLKKVEFIRLQILLKMII